MQYTTFEELPSGELKINLLPEGREEATEQLEAGQKSNYDIFLDLLETPLCNGYNRVLPETIGALTDSLIIADGVVDEETSPEDLKQTKFWWFPNYMVTDELTKLLEQGYLLFQPAK